MRGVHTVITMTFFRLGYLIHSLINHTMTLRHVQKHAKLYVEHAAMPVFSAAQQREYILLVVEALLKWKRQFTRARKWYTLASEA